ncbi:MAG: hypothetical protein IPK31_15100 [Chitinophagaceae bacterium]|nr:hypothetical protein [Chitinophagaceae bacterium]
MQPAGEAAQSGQSISTGLYISQTINVEDHRKRWSFLLLRHSLGEGGFVTKPLLVADQQQIFVTEANAAIELLLRRTLVQMEILLGKADFMRIHILTLKKYLLTGFRFYPYRSSVNNQDRNQ